MKQQTNHPLISGFLGQHAENVANIQKEYTTNSYPYYSESAEGNSLSRILQENLFKWRPWDRRRYMQFMDESYKLTATEFNKALYNSFDVSVVGAEDKGEEGKIEAHILIDAQAGELQQYNNLVGAVQKQRQQMKEAEFDAVTGSFKGNKFDATVHGGTPRNIKSSAKHLFQTPTNVLQDDLLSGVQLPKPDWRVAATWLITLKIKNNEFHVYSVVTSVKGRVISLIDLYGNDLSELGVQLMHRVFGNTVDSGKEADFYDGIRQLLAGEKLSGSCSSNCTAKAVARKQAFFDRLGILLIGLGALDYVFLALFWGFNGSWTLYVLGILLCLMGAIFPIYIAPLLTARAERDQARSINI